MDAARKICNFLNGSKNIDSNFIDRSLVREKQTEGETERRVVRYK